jgi:nucleotide-binding universal stress UspA family protein
MYDRILVSVDGSAFSEEVVPYARNIAEATGARLALLTVAERDTAKQDAQRYIDDLAARFGAEALTVTADHSVSADIQAEADRVPRTLVAITSRGRGGLLTAMLGSVARELVQSSHAPVLVYRPQGGPAADPEPARITTVLLPLDGDAPAETMQREAANWAIALKAELLIVQVVPPATRGDLLLSEYDVTDDSYVRARAEEVKLAFGINPSWEVLHGRPVAAISQYLGDRRDVLVVMATRQQKALHAAVLGSVTSGLLHRAGVPMVVKAP